MKIKCKILYDVRLKRIREKIIQKYHHLGDRMIDDHYVFVDLLPEPLPDTIKLKYNYETIARIISERAYSLEEATRALNDTLNWQP